MVEGESFGQVNLCQGMGTTIGRGRMGGGWFADYQVSEAPIEIRVDGLPELTELQSELVRRRHRQRVRQ